MSQSLVGRGRSKSWHCKTDTFRAFSYKCVPHMLFALSTLRCWLIHLCKLRLWICPWIIPAEVPFYPLSPAATLQLLHIKSTVFVNTVCPPLVICIHPSYQSRYEMLKTENNSGCVMIVLSLRGGWEHFLESWCTFLSPASLWGLIKLAHCVCVCVWRDTPCSFAAPFGVSLRRHTGYEHQLLRHLNSCGA